MRALTAWNGALTADLRIPSILCLLLASTSLISCSEAASRSPEDYRNATFSTTRVTAYQEASQDDEVLSLDGQTRFSDGTEEPEEISIDFGGAVKNQPGTCVFKLDDSRETNPDAQLLVRKCDGSSTQTFNLGDSQVSIRGHVKGDGDMPSEFYIDAIYGPKSLSYYAGFAPSKSDADDDDPGN